MNAIAKVVSPPPALFGMVQWKRYIDWGKTISTIGMIDFWPEKNSNDFLSVKGSRHFPRGPFLSEQSYLQSACVLQELVGNTRKFCTNFLVEPEFLLLHRNRYLEGKDGQKTPHGHPAFNSYMKILRVLLSITDGRTDGRTNREIHLLRVGWRNLPMLCVGTKTNTEISFSF
jgi:hypothetical protein